jgi:ATP-dependent Clp protease protease subunit
MVEMPGGDPRDRLRARRTVLLTGALDHDRATSLCAELMTLDGTSSDPVELIVNSRGGPLEALSSVLDVIGLMRAPLHTICIGAAAGTAGVLVACGPGERRAAPHATISLRCDHRESLEGSAADVGRAADALRVTLGRVRDTVAARTGQPVDVIGEELERGAVHDAPAALGRGWIDAIADRGPRT